MVIGGWVVVIGGWVGGFNSMVVLIGGWWFLGLPHEV